MGIIIIIIKLRKKKKEKETKQLTPNEQQSQLSSNTVATSNLSKITRAELRLPMDQNICFHYTLPLELLIYTTF